MILIFLGGGEGARGDYRHLLIPELLISLEDNNDTS